MFDPRPYLPSQPGLKTSALCWHDLPDPSPKRPEYGQGREDDCQRSKAQVRHNIEQEIERPECACHQYRHTQQQSKQAYDRNAEQCQLLVFFEILPQCHDGSKVRAAGQAAEVYDHNEVRAPEVTVVDYPTGEHEREARNELLIRKSEDQSVQNVPSKSASTDPLGTLVLAEQAV